MIFEGFTPTIEAWLRSASIVVATADQEPYGLTVVEAMSAATPVIAAGSAGHLETVGAASPDALFTPGETESLVEKLEHLMSNESARRSLGAQQQEHQQRCLTLEGQELQTRQVYESVIA